MLVILVGNVADVVDEVDILDKVGVEDAEEAEDAVLMVVVWGLVDTLESTIKVFEVIEVYKQKDVVFFSMVLKVSLEVEIKAKVTLLVALMTLGDYTFSLIITSLED